VSVGGGVEVFMLAGEVVSPVLLEVALSFSARSLRMASEPLRPHRDPVMASLSAMMWRQAPSIGPVAIGQPEASAVS